ncbi:capsule biosynthesis protein [Rhodobacter calidifons]|uniref:Capsule biosynthesis protein n=1 Tax=Rhodobacter calidifons TaxID=2715277 RepID=A0ABX0G872_9RHOB|nr:capsule biosynthesis protein [Rhodobacter calidifons]NHB77483.1 capsule biosynthesis protein [Rhodobacter calidifons]
MTTNPKAARYHTRRVERPALPEAGGDGTGIFDTHEDGFGNLDFRRDADRPGPAAAPVAETTEGAEPARATAQAPAAEAGTPEQVEAALAAIAAEGLTSRQLRRALLIAEKHGIRPVSEFDAVRQLREAGIDPFSRASLLRIVSSNSADAGADAPPPPRASRELTRLPGDQVQLPKKVKPIAVPSTEQRAEVNQAAEILRMQKDIARRRRRRLALLGARLFAFVMLPTFLAGWYFYMIATPIYSVRSEFVIQQAGPASSGGSLGGLFSGTAFATSQDSIAVQGYLQSREAMARLDADLGFRRHFQDERFDPLQRLDPDASLEAAYKVYKKFLKISFDTTEGVIRMDVMAADPQVAADWSRQLISYAEGQVDHLTQRLREDQMRDAQAGYDAAQEALLASQRRLIELQEKFKILSTDSEVGLIVGQISGLESQLTQERLSLAQMEANPNPNQARMEPVKRRIATLEGEVAALRARLTENSGGVTSLAEVQGELLVAQADMQTRQMLLAQALQSMETARIEANRQVRYLSLSVSPIPPDEPSYPRAFENTLVTMLILLGIYLMVSMTAAILREQVSS